jgi:hypothetical protein
MSEYFVKCSVIIAGWTSHIVEWSDIIESTDGQKAINVAKGRFEAELISEEIMNSPGELYICVDDIRKL